MTTADEIPLFPLEAVLFPGGALGLRIFETRYIDMVRRCLRESRGFGVVLISAGGEVGPAEYGDVGTYANIVDFHRLEDGLLGISCAGERRFRIRVRARQADGLNLGEVDWLEPDPPIAVPPRHAGLVEILRSVLPRLSHPYASHEIRLDDAAWVGYRLAEILPLPLADKQALLEGSDPVQRLDVLAPATEAYAADGEPGDSLA